MGGLCSAIGICDEADELNCSRKEEVIPEPPLAGRWLSSRGKQHVIGLDAIQWASGETTPLRKLRQVRTQKGQPKRTEWAMDLKGNRYTAHVNEEGNLQWSDGDVWSRDFRAPETGTYAAVSGVLVKATESFHEALSNTPVAFSSAASVVASPLTSGWGGGKSAAGSPSSGQVPGEVVEGVSQNDRQSAMDQAYNGGPATLAQQQQRQVEFHVPPQAAPYGSGSAAAMPTQLVGGMQPGRPCDMPPGHAAVPPQGAPQGSPQYLQHGVPQASQQPQQVHVPSGPLAAQQGQQPMPQHFTPAPQQRVQRDISPQVLPQAQLPMQATAQPMQQPGPPVFPEALSPEGPRPKRRVAPSPRPTM